MPVSINTHKTLGVNAHTRIIPPPLTSGFEDTTSFALDGVDDFLNNTNSFDTLPADNSSVSASGAKWTINMWVKFDSISGNQYIYYISEAGGALVTYLFINGNGRLQAFIAGSGSNWTRSGNIITAGTWYMISVKYDSTISNRYQRLRIRVNGAAPTGHASNFYAANHAISENIHLGTNFAENSPMEGNINEPAIFNGYYASDAELLDLYNSGAATNLNDHSTVPTNWFRSENATWDGTDYTLTDEMGTGKTIKTNNMAEASREADVPT